MITAGLGSYAIKHFSKNYMALLSKIYEDKKTIEKLFADSKIKQAFTSFVETYFDVLSEFYEKNPNATYLDEHNYMLNNPLIRNCLNDYYQLTKDTQLFKFLQIYSYCLQEYSKDMPILDENNLVIPNRVKDFFSATFNNSIGMYEQVKVDLENKNYWWLRDNATTLRRQLSDDFVVLSNKRFQALCDKYFRRKVDLKKEFYEAKNGGERLFMELDDVMYETEGVLPFYCYFVVGEDGKKILVKAEEPPKDGTYSFNAYHKILTTEKDDKQM